jgi:F-type H+-transporting ATPase subunit b
MNAFAVVAAGEPGAALPHLAEIIVGFVAFSILVYIVGTRAWPMFVKSHQDDTGRIQSGIERADADQEEARAELARNREKLAGVDNEAARIRDDARADAERIKEDMARRADEEAERIRAQGRQSLEASRSRTVSLLRAGVGAQSVELARRIVEQSLSDDASKGQSVDRFLDELEGMSGGSANGSRTPSGGSSTAGASSAASGSSGGSESSSGESSSGESSQASGSQSGGSQSGGSGGALPGFPTLSSNGDS